MVRCGRVYGHVGRPRCLRHRPVAPQSLATRPGDRQPEKNGNNRKWCAALTLPLSALDSTRPQQLPPSPPPRASSPQLGAAPLASCVGVAARACGRPLQACAVPECACPELGKVLAAADDTLCHGACNIAGRPRRLRPVAMPTAALGVGPALARGHAGSGHSHHLPLPSPCRQQGAGFRQLDFDGRGGRGHRTPACVRGFRGHLGLTLPLVPRRRRHSRRRRRFRRRPRRPRLSWRSAL